MDRRKAEADAIIGLVKMRRMTSSSAFRHIGYQFRTPGQSLVLAMVFEITIYPSCGTRKDLAVLLNMPLRSVQIWFQNSRQSLKYNLGRGRPVVECARGTARRCPADGDRCSEVRSDILLGMVIGAYKSILHPAESVSHLARKF
jgi:hypothetical protein